MASKALFLLALLSAAAVLATARDQAHDNKEKATDGVGVNDWHGGGGGGGGYPGGGGHHGGGGGGYPGGGGGHGGGGGYPGGGGGHGGGGGVHCRYRCCYYGSHGCARCCATPDEVPQPQVKN